MIPDLKTPLALLLLLILPALWWYGRRSNRTPVFRFSSTGLLSGMKTTWRGRWRLVPGLLRLLALALLIIALAGPRKVLEQSQVTTSGIDIVLALDVSGSMAAEDFQMDGHRINRLDMIKSVVKSFVKERKYDRLALVVFGSQAYTVCPLTTDHNWLLENLARVRLGVIQDATAIGSGIASSLTRLKRSPDKSKVIVLLTDGINNAGKIAPLTAAKAAQALGVKIYTIGVGTNGPAPFPVTDVFGNHFYENVQFQLDEDSLKQIASMTGGQYFRATDTKSLREIYQHIDKMEKTKIVEKGYKQYQPLFGPLIIAALLLLAAEATLTNSVFLKIP